MRGEATEGPWILGAHRRALFTAVIAGSVLISSFAFASFGRGPQTNIVTSPHTPATPAVPVDAVELPEGTPDTILALAPDTGVVAILDPGTGVPLRVLATHPPAGVDGRTLQGAALTPDRRTAYYALAGGCDDVVLYRVQVDGRSRPRWAAQGVSPAVSPDGRKLAYAALGPPVADGLPSCPNVVVVRDLRTGKERRWRFPDDDDHRRGLFMHAAFTRLAWAPDSRRLAITHSYEGDSVSVLDTDTATDLSETIEVVIPGGGGDSRHPTWQASTGRLAVVNRAFECCFEDIYTGPPRTLLVDVEARLYEDLLPPGSTPGWLDFDATGEHLLYVDGGTLYRFRVGGDAALVAPGFTIADW